METEKDLDLIEDNQTSKTTEGHIKEVSLTKEMKTSFLLGISISIIDSSKTVILSCSTKAK